MHKMTVPQLWGSGAENGNPLQYSCLENSMDRGIWAATVLWGCKEWDMTEWVLTHIALMYGIVEVYGYMSVCVC